MLGTPSASSSPIIAASPTLASSPVMSPIPEHHDNTFPTTIALSILLGLLVIGAASWAGIAYRRRSRRIRDFKQDPGPKVPTKSEMFDAGTIMEKGLMTRSSSSRTLTATIRPTSLYFAPASGQPEHQASSDESASWRSLLIPPIRLWICITSYTRPLQIGLGEVVLERVDDGLCHWRIMPQ